MIETTLLKTLVTVVKAGSFSNAAYELDVTQSAISQNIKNMEKKVGATLINRSGRKIVLTKEGEKVFNFAQKYLGDMDEIIDDIRTRNEGMSGRLRVGCLNGVGKTWLTPLLINFSRKYEALNIKITLGLAQDIVESYEQYGLDCIVVPDQVVPTGQCKEYIGNEKIVFVYPKKHEFELDFKKFSFDDIASLPFIFFENDDLLYMKWMNHVFGRTKKNIQKKFIVNSHGAMLQAVSQGLGVAVVPTHILNRSKNKSKINVLEDPYVVNTSDLYFVYHNEDKDTEKINTLVSFMKEDLTAGENPFHPALTHD